MSRKFRVLTLAVLAIVSVGIFATSAYADVTGTFGTHISIRPQTNVSEVSLVDFDIQNELNITAVISGLSSTFHTHFGIAGVEDVQLTMSATLGALDIETLLVFGRFAFGSIDPFYDSLHFIKKIVRANIQLGGVSFSNTATFEDTNAFVSQSPAYAFGDVFSLAGQTPSGVSISATAGLCTSLIPNSIKKHFALSPYSVNPDCATEPKPDILFDFEEITIEGVPVAPNVTATSTVLCVQVSACSLTTEFTFAGGPIPFSATLEFTDLLSLEFTGAVINLTSGAGTLSLEILPSGALGVVGVSVVAVLNPDTNPASLTLEAEVVPGVGLLESTISFSVQRAGLIFGANVVFAGGPPAVFTGATFSLSVPGDLLSLEADSTFDSNGLQLANIWLTVSF